MLVDKDITWAVFTSGGGGGGGAGGAGSNGTGTSAGGGMVVHIVQVPSTYGNPGIQLSGAPGPSGSYCWWCWWRWWRWKCQWCHWWFRWCIIKDAGEPVLMREHGIGGNVDRSSNWRWILVAVVVAGGAGSQQRRWKNGGSGLVLDRISHLINN